MDWEWDCIIRSIDYLALDKLINDYLQMVAQF